MKQSDFEINEFDVGHKCSNKHDDGNDYVSYGTETSESYTSRTNDDYKPKKRIIRLCRSCYGKLDE